MAKPKSPSDGISFDDVDRALNYLRDNAVPAAQARAENEYLEHWVKVVLAEEMQQNPQQPVSAQERDARASVRFLQALQALKEAKVSDYTHRFMREAAAAKIEAWRTQESTRRAEGKAYS